MASTQCSGLTVPHIDVACGVLVNPIGEVLIVERPHGKIAQGKWEFPGGKIEAGETPRQALDRELHEELGIIPRAARPLICFTHCYSNRVVRLFTFRIDRWDGELSGREGQRMQWCDPGVAPELDLLPTVWPSLQAMRLPETYVFTPTEADAGALLERLHALPRAALLRLRWPTLHDAEYTRLAQQLLRASKAFDLRIILDRGEAMARSLGADGCHYPQSSLAEIPELTSDPGFLRIASCHDAESITLARKKGFDAMVVGSVKATPSHADAKSLGWAGFEELATTANVPVYAIGGLSPEDLNTAFVHYAQGIAGISAYWSRSGS